MHISIIGSNSLLASYIIEEFSQNSSVTLSLFGKTKPVVPNASAQVSFFLFDYPNNAIDFSLLLPSDVVIYCAAAGVQANSLISQEVVYEINALLPIKIVNYLSQNNFLGKWISFGTYFEIGNNNGFQYYTEEQVVLSPLNVPNAYCLSKRVLSRFLDSSLVGVNAWHLILPTIYGVKENAMRLIPYIVNSLKKNEFPKLSSGEQIRQYLHCRDLVALLKLLIFSENKPGLYNVCSKESVKIADLVKIIFSKFEEDAAKSLGSITTRDEAMQVLLLDSAKMKLHIPNWQPSITLETGVAEYI